MYFLILIDKGFAKLPANKSINCLNPLKDWTKIANQFRYSKFPPAGICVDPPLRYQVKFVGHLVLLFEEMRRFLGSE